MNVQLRLGKTQGTRILSEDATSLTSQLSKRRTATLAASIPTWELPKGLMTFGRPANVTQKQPWNACLW